MKKLQLTAWCILGATLLLNSNEFLWDLGLGSFALGFLMIFLGEILGMFKD